MNTDKNTIKCPKCGNEINVNEILVKEVQESLVKEYQAKSDLKDKEYQKKLSDLEKEKGNIAKDKEDLQATIEKEVKTKLSTEKSKIESNLRIEIEAENSDQIKTLETALMEKSNQVKELNKTKGELEKIKREKEELKDKIESEAEQKYTGLLEKERVNIKAQLESTIEDTVKSKVSVEKTKIEKSLRFQIETEKSEQLKSLEDELKEKSNQVIELNRTKSELEKIKREKNELKDKIEAEAEIKYSDLLNKEKEKIKTVEYEKGKTELQKRDKLIDDLNRRLEDAQIKLEQGSNKLSGEVKEIELKEYLKSRYPMDDIKDIASGKKGADVCQIVKNQFGKQSGIILYERKQTQRFDEKWIPKLKGDGIDIKADICVLVTKIMPKEEQEAHRKDSIWICTNEDLGIVSALLREALIRQYGALDTQADKGTKMEMIYDYLRSNDFQNHVLGILDSFKKMDRALLREKEDALKKFAERESHIFQAKQSVLNFWGRVDGIALDSIGHEMKMLGNS